jgi:hypothetical protein
MAPWGDSLRGGRGGIVTERVTAPDGVDVQVLDEGSGPTLLVVHPGLDDGSGWAAVAGLLADRFRVVRLRRRPYRADLAVAGPWSIAQEASDVVALARSLPQPVVLVGHSSGAVVSLEALVGVAGDAPGTFSGAVLYEPPLLLEPDEFEPAVTEAEAAVAAGRPARAMRIFLRDIVRTPGSSAAVAGTALALLPRLRRLVPGQVADARALNDLGVRLDAYAGVDVPVVLVSGPRSPHHLRQREDALAAVLPHARIVALDPRQGHSANVQDPTGLARVVADAATSMVG